MMRALLLALWLSATVFAAAPTHSSPAPAVIWTIELGSWGAKPALVLLTGFGPFGPITDNPAGRIVHPLARELEKNCGDGVALESHELPVKFGIIDTLPLEHYHKILNIGVDAGTSGIRIETEATNYFYDPETGESGPIDPTRPTYATLSGGPLPLEIDRPLNGFTVTLGGMGTAGSYVCNDTFYRVCRRNRFGYFIHIPNITPTEDSRLASALGNLACRIFKTPDALEKEKDKHDGVTSDEPVPQIIFP